MKASCINKVNATHKCKAISSDQSQKIVPQNDETNKKFRHHWIPGNLPLHSECEVCEEVSFTKPVTKKSPDSCQKWSKTVKFCIRLYKLVQSGLRLSYLLHSNMSGAVQTCQ